MEVDTVSDKRSRTQASTASATSSQRRKKRRTAAQTAAVSSDTASAMLGGLQQFQALTPTQQTTLIDATVINLSQLVQSNPKSVLRASEEKEILNAHDELKQMLHNGRAVDEPGILQALHGFQVDGRNGLLPRDLQMLERCVHTYPRISYAFHTHAMELTTKGVCERLASSVLHLPVMPAWLENLLLTEAGRMPGPGEYSDIEYDFPACHYGTECVGMRNEIPGQTRPVVLCAFMFEEEWESFLQTRCVSFSKRPCILCCRSQMRQAVEAVNTLAARYQDLDWSRVNSLFPQPYTNVIARGDVSAQAVGYPEHHLLKPSPDFRVLTSPIVNFQLSGLLAREIELDEGRKRLVVDQVFMLDDFVSPIMPNPGEKWRDFHGRGRQAFEERGMFALQRERATPGWFSQCLSREFPRVDQARLRWSPNKIRSFVLEGEHQKRANRYDALFDLLVDSQIFVHKQGAFPIALSYCDNISLPLSVVYQCSFGATDTASTDTNISPFVEGRKEKSKTKQRQNKNRTSRTVPLFQHHGDLMATLLMLNKSIPQPCQTRCMPDMFYRYVFKGEHPHRRYVLGMQLLLVTLTGYYPWVSREQRPSAEQRVDIYTLLLMSERDINAVFHRIRLLVEFAVREFIVYAVKMQPALYDQLCYLCDWPMFQRYTTEGAEALRSLVRKYGFRELVASAVAAQHTDLSPESHMRVILDEAQAAYKLYHDKVLRVSYRRILPLLISVFHKSRPVPATAVINDAALAKEQQAVQAIRTKTSSVEAMAGLSSEIQDMLVSDENEQTLHTNDSDDDEDDDNDSTRSRRKSKRGPVNYRPLTRALYTIFSRFPPTRDMPQAALDALHQFDVDPVAFAELMEIRGIHDQHQTGARAIRRRIDALAAEHPYTVYVLQRACAVWQQHYRTRPVPLPLAAVKAQIKAFNKLHRREDQDTVVLEDTLFHFCALCGRAYSPVRDSNQKERVRSRAARNKSLIILQDQTPEDYNRTLVADTKNRIQNATLPEKYKLASRAPDSQKLQIECLTGSLRCVNPSCHVRELVSVSLLGQVLCLPSMTVLACVQCGVFFVYRDKDCSSNQDGMICHACTLQQRIEQIFDTRCGPVLLKGRLRCFLCLRSNRILETYRCYLYPPSVAVCEQHFNREQQQVVTSALARKPRDAWTNQFTQTLLLRVRDTQKERMREPMKRHTRHVISINRMKNNFRRG